MGLVLTFSRICALSFVLLLQLWVGWTFLSNQMERAGGSGSATVAEPKQTKPKTGVCAQFTLSIYSSLSLSLSLSLSPLSYKEEEPR